MAPSMDEVALTTRASCAGCAAKLGPGPLSQILEPLRRQRAPKELLIGLDVADDAAVWQVSENQAIVSTIDFFPPIVDDAYQAGAIAAANALSDVYAMGGEVLFALNVAAWPEDLPLTQLERVFAGAVSVVGAAGATIVGGHTIIDAEPKFGLSVTGMVDPKHLLLKSALQPGDVLWLTKPIGTGVLTTAHKRGALAAADLAAVVASMTALNRSAARAAVEAGLHAATDVTGFSLAGHAHEMAERSGVRVTIDASSVPLLATAREHAAAGDTPGGTERNRDHFVGGGRVVFDGVDATTANLMLDPQTSGGLLIGVPASHAAAWDRARAAHQVTAWRIGDASAGSGVVITGIA